MATLEALSPSRAQAGPAERRYTAVAIILHWVIAAAIAFQLIGGTWMVSAGAAATGAVFTLFQVHKTVGLAILALTLARIIWRLGHRAPALPAGMSRAERAGAQAAHVGFYLLLLGLPLSGWAMASVSPTGVPTFFLLLERLPFAHLPLLPEGGLAQRHAAEAMLKQAHHALALAMALLIGLHVAAALKHQFIARDNLLARMILSARTVPGSMARAGVGALAALAAVGFLAGGIAWGVSQVASGAPRASLAATPAATPQPGNWIIDHPRSRLGFEIQFSGSPVAGTIGSWQGAIRFDPQDLDRASAAVTIDMASVRLANPTLQAQAAGADGFDLAIHPAAGFTASSFAQLEPGTFRADGVLTLRGIPVAVPLVFTFEEQEGFAIVRGSATLDRLAFGIGAVGAAGESWLRRSVEVTFDLVATRP